MAIKSPLTNNTAGMIGGYRSPPPANIGVAPIPTSIQPTTGQGLIANSNNPFLIPDNVTKNMQNKNKEKKQKKLVKTKNGNKLIKGAQGIKPEVVDKDGNVIKMRAKSNLGQEEELEKNVLDDGL